MPGYKRVQASDFSNEIMSGMDTKDVFVIPIMSGESCLNLPEKPSDANIWIDFDGISGELAYGSKTLGLTG